MLGAMPFLRSADLDLFYTDEGPAGGASVLLVHGWACDSHDWSWEIPALADVHRVIAADLRGHGSSSYRGEEVTIDAFAADLLALLDHLGIARAIVVGHSMGAVIASIIAAQHPQRVSGIVVIDPPYGFDAEAAEANLDFAAQIDAGTATRRQPAAHRRTHRGPPRSRARGLRQ